MHFCALHKIYHDLRIVLFLIVCKNFYLAFCIWTDRNRIRSGGNLHPQILRSRHVALCTAVTINTYLQKIYTSARSARAPIRSIKSPVLCCFRELCWSTRTGYALQRSVFQGLKDGSRESPTARRHTDARSFQPKHQDEAAVEIQ